MKLNIRRYTSFVIGHNSHSRMIDSIFLLHLRFLFSFLNVFSPFRSLSLFLSLSLIICTSLLAQSLASLVPKKPVDCFTDVDRFARFHYTLSSRRQ